MTPEYQAEGQASVLGQRASLNECDTIETLTPPLSQASLKDLCVPVLSCLTSPCDPAQSIHLSALPFHHLSIRRDPGPMIKTPKSSDVQEATHPQETKYDDH